MFRGLLIRQVFGLVDLSLALVLAFVAYLTVVNILESDAPVPTTETVSANPGTETDLVIAKVGSREDYNAIADSGIFGDAARAKKDLEPAPPTTVEKTSRRLALLGTAATGNEFANAIIKNDEEGGKTDVYSIGDEVVAGQLKLTEVRPREVLMFDIAANRTEVLPMDDPNAVSVSPDMPRRLIQPPLPVRKAPLSGSAPIEVNKERFVKEVVDNYSDLVTKVNPEPYTDTTGRVTGYKIGNLSELPMAEELGLKDGDVVQKVNGITIDSEEKILEVAQKFANFDTFRISILRDGKPQVVTYKLK